MTTPPAATTAQSNAPAAPTEDAVHLCALADLLLLALEPFRRPDDPALRGQGVSEQLEGLLTAAGVAPEAPLAVALRRTMEQSLRTDPRTRSAEHHRLFEGATVCPLNQTAWVRRDKGVIIGDLCGFYRAFGFVPAAHTGEKPDHLLPQIEFLALLLVMLAGAEGEDRQVTRDALRDYAEVHVCDWLGCVWQRLAQVAATELHLAAAESLREAWEHVSTQLRLPPPTRTPDSGGSIPEPESEPDERLECGGVTSFERVELRRSGRKLPDRQCGNAEGLPAVPDSL